MAIDIKEILVNGLLDLCVNYPLESITIKQLLEQTGVSRQTFYNHFLDKDDLIHYVYDTKIIPDFNHDNMDLCFYDSLLLGLKNMKEYHNFMKQACLMEGQNCLKDYIFDHCKDFDLKWHQELYGSNPMPKELKFATEYHANASSSMTLSWILSNMPISCENLAEMIVNMRSVGMEILFQNGETKGNPYK